MKHPEKVRELQAAFLIEAQKYHVLPLDDRLSERFDVSLRPNPLAGLKSCAYGPGATNISESVTLNTYGVPFSLTAGVEMGNAGADGVLTAIGDITSGWLLYVTGGRPTFYDNFFAEAKARGWTVVSMTDEWKIIFPVAAGQ